jgi:hypothetical protein
LLLDGHGTRKILQTGEIVNKKKLKWFLFHTDLASGHVLLEASDENGCNSLKLKRNRKDECAEDSRCKGKTEKRMTRRHRQARRMYTLNI